MIPKYKTVDYRAVVKCDVCRCWVEGPDKAGHSQWHADLTKALKQSDTEIQGLLFEPPF